MTEVLIGSIFVDADSIKVTPSNCPGAARDDILRDVDGEPTCVLNHQICEYLNKVTYNADTQEQTLICMVE